MYAKNSVKSLLNFAGQFSNSEKNVFKSYNRRDLVVFYAYICYVLHGELGGVSYSQADGRAHQIGRRSSRREFEIFSKLLD